MSHSDFYNITKLQENKLTKSTKGKMLKIGDIKILKIEKADLTEKVRAFYKTSYIYENYKEIKLIKIR